MADLNPDGRKVTESKSRTRKGAALRFVNVINNQSS